MKRVISLVCLLFVSTFIVSNVSEAYTTKYKIVQGYNGSAVSYFNKKSKTIWVGDSRIVQMYNYKHKQSYVALWGGHYGYGGSKYQIDYESRFNDLKKMIKKTKKKYGYANVCLEPTINDYSGGSGYLGALSLYKKAYKRVRKLGKNINIYTPTLIKARNGASCEPYNNALKKSVKHYINIRVSDNQYSDSLHFNEKGLKHIYKKVHKYMKKHEPKIKTREESVRGETQNVMQEEVVSKTEQRYEVKNSQVLLIERVLGFLWEFLSTANY